MASKKKKTIDQILKEQVPNARRVRQTGAADHAPHYAPPEQISPDLNSLRRKYFGSALNVASEDAGADAASHNDDDTEIVMTEKRNAPEHDPATGRKGVVISRSKGKVIGEQG